MVHPTLILNPRLKPLCEFWHRLSTIHCDYDTRISRIQIQIGLLVLMVGLIAHPAMRGTRGTGWGVHSGYRASPQGNVDERDL